MLENIHIQNFRCFEDFKAEGFERINLIGGENNSGKTCFLEGIQCININLVTIAQQRNQSIPLLSITNFNTVSRDIKISFKSDKNYENEINLSETYTDANRVGELLKANIQYIKGEIKNPQFKVAKIINKYDSAFPNPSIVSLVEILQMIDPKVEGLHALNDDDLAIVISKQAISLNDFGDGFKYLLNYFVNFIDKKHSGDSSETILLIDEVENGIHYSIHYDFWKAIFKLSAELNVQVFATTHSLEMIQQFNKVAKEEGEGAYFEMGKEYETGKIFAFKHDTELLEYELEKTTSTIRG